MDLTAYQHVPWKAVSQVPQSGVLAAPLRQYMDQVKLRFSVGAIVECRVGTDPVTGWAGGRVLSLYYREANWPPTSIAPYKVKLDDGRSIFAPADDDQVIRLKKIST